MGKKVFLIYSNTYSNVSKFLNVFMNVDYTHISISIDQDISKFYSFGRRNFYMPLIGGFVEESRDDRIFSHFSETIIEVVEKELTDSEYNIIKRELEKYKIFSRLYKYNILGVPLMWFNIPFERERHFACSQFVGYIIEKSGIYTFAKSWSLLQPNDIREMSGLKTIYKGKMTEFDFKGDNNWNDLVNY